MSLLFLLFCLAQESGLWIVAPVAAYACCIAFTLSAVLAWFAAIRWPAVVLLTWFANDCVCKIFSCNVETLGAQDDFIDLMVTLAVVCLPFVGPLLPLFLPSTNKWAASESARRKLPRLGFVGIAWGVSLIAVMWTFPEMFDCRSNAATMLAASFLMLVFGPYLFVAGVCEAWAGEAGCWRVLAVTPLYVAHLAFLWKLSSMTSLWHRIGKSGSWAHRVVFVLMSLFSALGVWYELPQVETHSVAIAGGKIKAGAIRFVLVTDLHSCSYGYPAQELLVDAVRRVNPDAVLLAGDIFDDRLSDGNAQCVIERLSDKFPCFYVTGNHEYWSGGVDEIKRWLRGNGVTVLEGDARTVTLKGTPIDFCGVDDPTYILDDAWREQLVSAYAKSNPKHLRVLLTHRPEYADIYRQFDFDLIVAGHLHGGQWRIPGFNVGLCGPACNDRRLLPHYSGGSYLLSASTEMLVSRGLARESTPLPRFFNHPELMVIDVSAKQDGTR